MKILQIRGANLASLADEFSIDLQSGPLGRTGLFAITGPTGSGKSSILDAVCLALYAQVPRTANQTSRSKAPAGGDSDLALDDPRHILRRGAGTGYAEVEFRAANGQTYTARWDVWRSRKRATGKLQPHKMSLQDATGQGLGGATNTSVLTAIAQRTGLTFAQFRRAILLAQGDFAAFLKAGTEDRANLLEAMTGTEIYGTLSVLAYERRKLWEQSITDATNKLTLSAPLDEQARDVLDEGKRRADTAVSQQEQRAATIAETLAWYKQLDAKQRSLANATEALTTATAGAAVAAPRKNDLAVATRAWGLRVPLRDVRSLATRGEQVARTLAEAQALVERVTTDETSAESRRLTSHLDLAVASTGYVAAISEALDSERSRANSLGEWLAGHTAEQSFSSPGRLDEMRDQVSTWSGLLDTLATTRAAAERHTKRIAQDQVAVPELRLAADRTTAAAAAATTAETDARRTLSTHDADAIDARAATLENSRAVLANLRGLDGRREVLTARLDEASATHKAAEKDHTELTTTCTRLAPATAIAQARLGDAQQVLRKYESALNANEWRAQLTPDTECAVCGSKQHPWADGSAVQQLKADHDARVRELDAEYRALHDESTRLGAAADAAAERMTQSAAAQQQSSSALDKLRAERSGLAAIAGETNAEDLDAFKRALETEAEMVTGQKKALRGANDAVLATTGLAATAAKAATKSTEALTHARTQLERLRSDHKRALEDIETAVEGRDKVITTISRSLAPLDIATAWAGPAQADAAMHTLARRVADWRENNRALEELDVSTRRREQQHATATTERSQHVAGLSPQQLAGHTQVEALADLDADGLVTWRNDQRETAAAKAEQASHHAGQTKQRCSEAQTALAIAASAHDTHLTTAKRKDAELAEELAAAELSIQEVQRWLAVDDEWRDREGAALEQIDNALVRAQAIADSETKALAAYKLSQPKQSHEDAASAHARIDETLSTLREQASALGAQCIADDEKRRAQSADTAELERLRSEAKPWLQIAELIGHNSGKTFKSYAQSVTLGILLRGANVHLRQLNPRYELRVSNLTQLEVEVIDHDLADERRSVHHLSGGETFLTSLALALSLSSLAAGATQLGSLFIDEGLGTLDIDTLDVALGILENLHDTGRQVGLISHVPGLAERVSARVDVIPLGGGKSRVEVP